MYLTYTMFRCGDQRVLAEMILSQGASRRSDTHNLIITNSQIQINNDMNDAHILIYPDI